MLHREVRSLVTATIYYLIINMVSTVVMMIGTNIIKCLPGPAVSI